jgi:FMN phosphatase YigB (HAD superfamily)
MRIAIVHYHLSPGGVTRLIESTSKILTDAGIDPIILIGTGSRNLPTDLPIHEIEGLNYLKSPGNHTAETLLESLRAAAKNAFGSGPDLWHFHNHSLGKNLLLDQVVAQLSVTDRMVLQLHDLAEDGRPQNEHNISEPRTLYPVAPHISYLFLNSKDAEVFQSAGLPASQCPIFPNPIEPVVCHTPPKNSPALLLAPIRAIRRKNVGELILLAALAPRGTRVAITRAPENPDALPVYQRWKSFAEKHHIPIEFEVVDRLSPSISSDSSFQSWVDHATHFVTTSVAEGFGYPFLESVAAQKPLIGRNLPHLTRDHPAIPQTYLYDRLLIPASMVERTENSATISNAETSDLTIGQTLETAQLDFGNLPEPVQKSIILRLIANPHFASNLSAWLESAISDREVQTPLAQLEPYSFKAYEKKLTELYQHLIGQPISPITYLEREKILDRYRTPENFHHLLNSPPIIRSVIFDIYGTLLIAPSGAVKSDPDFDPTLQKILRHFGHPQLHAPTALLHAAVLKHHAASSASHPEIDLRQLWREILSLPPEVDTAPLVQAIEDAWHPCSEMPGAGKTLRTLARSGVILGVLSNAQSNTLPTLDRLLGNILPDLTESLTLFSYQHGVAKPSPDFFQLLVTRLAERGISPGETLFVGNDPQQDILPAAAHGFRTALFTGHPSSRRPGNCRPDFILENLSDLPVAVFS